MSDLIDRQAAIDALSVALNEVGILDMDDVKTVFDMLPSVQPEIIRCKDCAKREYCRISTVWAVPPSDDWFCGDAEPYKGEQE